MFTSFNRSSNLFRTSLRGVRTILTQPIPSAPNIVLPDHVIIVNGGATVALSALKQMKNKIDTGNTITTPKTLTILLAPPLAGAHSNKFVQAPFGQSVMHLTTKDWLSASGFAQNARPPIKDYSDSVSSSIYEVAEEIQQKSPCKIRIHQLNSEDYLKYYPNGRFFISNEHTGDQVLVHTKDRKAESLAVIDASRVYGKFYHDEIKVFRDVQMQTNIRQQTKRVTDIYQMSEDDIRITLKKATSTGEHVPLIGAGLTTLWMIPSILAYGFKPLIINTDKKDPNYDSFMTYANEWTRAELCQQLKCGPEELNEKLLEMTRRPDDIKYNSNGDIICRLNEQDIVINELYDSTGYCANKSYLKDIPQQYVIDPCPPIRASCDYISTLLEKGYDQITTIEEMKIKDLIDMALGKTPYDLMDQNQEAIQDLYSALDTNKLLLHIQQLDEAIQTSLEMKKEDVELVLRARKILLLAKNLDHLYYLHNHEDYEHQFKTYNSEIGVSTLAFSQHLSKKLYEELKNPISKDIAKKFQMNINEDFRDGRGYHYHGHAPLGSAASLLKLTSHILGLDHGFNLVDTLTSDAEIENLSKHIYKSMPEGTMHFKYLHELILRTVRETVDNTDDIYDFSKWEIKPKYTKEEFPEFFFNKIKEKIPKRFQNEFEKHKDVIIGAITQDIRFQYPDQGNPRKKTI